MRSPRNTLAATPTVDFQSARELTSCIFETPLGWLGFLGTFRGMTNLTFGHPSRDAVIDALGAIEDEDFDSDAQAPAWVNHARDLLTAYCAAEPVDLGQILLDIGHRTPFEQRVRQKVQQIGYGQTITYGELAVLAGAPRAARAVGSVMARNPLPLVIPCHRVVAASGKLGGYSAPAGLSMKEHLLAMEQQAADVPATGAVAAG